MLMATATHPQQGSKHMLILLQELTQAQTTHPHTHRRLRPPQAAAPTMPQPWKSMQFTPGMLLLGQAAKAVSQSVASGPQPARVHRPEQVEAMVPMQHMRLSQGMGITLFMGTMLTMRWGLFMGRARSRLHTEPPSRMTRALA